MVNYIKEKIGLRKVKMNNEWKKHDGSPTCPEEKDAIIEVETWSTYTVITPAANLEWMFVKFYRVIPVKK